MLAGRTKQGKEEAGSNHEQDRADQRHTQPDPTTRETRRLLWHWQSGFLIGNERLHFTITIRRWEWHLYRSIIHVRCHYIDDGWHFPRILERLLKHLRRER